MSQAAHDSFLTVDGGQTARYVYDALNHRVSTQDGNGTNEYLFDAAGKRISTWVASSNFGSEGRIYWGNQQLAFRSSDGTTYFDHQDWTGTERVRSTFAGSTAALYASFAYGDTAYAFDILNPNSGYNQDNAFYAGLDYDSGSGTDHATFRQYNPGQGRWMSPDPYSGSYDPSNPQSYNRYSYVLNNPVTFTDPSGQCLECLAPICGPVCGTIIGTAGGVFDLGELLGWWGGSSFHGSLKPRPSSNAGWDGNFGESLGIPTSIPQGNFGLGMALGLPSQGCEFGPCGSGPNSFGPGAGAIAGTIACQFAEPCGAIEDVALIVGAAGVLGYDVWQMSQHGRGNQADTGVENEARQRFPQLDMCSALDMLMAEARAAGNSAKQQRIKKTQKAYGCRRSRE